MNMHDVYKKIASIFEESMGDIKASDEGVSFSYLYDCYSERVLSRIDELKGDLESSDNQEFICAAIDIMSWSYYRVWASMVIERGDVDCFTQVPEEDVLSRFLQNMKSEGYDVVR